MTEAEAIEAAPAPQLEPSVTPQIDQLTAAFEGHLFVLLQGICVCNAQIPAHIVWPALVRAAGRCFSRATKAPKLEQTLELRNQFAAAFENELRRFIPAIDRAVAVPAAANGNGLVAPTQ